MSDDKFSVKYNPESGFGFGIAVGITCSWIFMIIMFAVYDYEPKFQALKHATVSPSLTEIYKYNEECMKDMNNVDECVAAYKANIYIYNQITKR